MHPLIFVTSWVLLGTMFALQDWVLATRSSNYHVGLVLLIKAWGVQYFIWGLIFWVAWNLVGQRIRRTELLPLIVAGIPISLLCCILEEMIWVACFPRLPLNRPQMPYWERLWFNLDAELVDNLVIFWCTFALFRGIGHYQQLREKEEAAAELRTQLAHAQVHALRMQLNPHFLFNTMNSISSLIQIDPASADAVLEQLSSLLRMTLERGEVQLIPLNEEIQFTELYLAMQDLRFSGRIRQEISVEPELHDALVPAMILQPLVENAYTHGFSKTDREGWLTISAKRQETRLQVRVSNSGLGLLPRTVDRTGLGLDNVRRRLLLHYGEEQSFSIEELSGHIVRVTFALPLSFGQPELSPLTRYGVA